jgi:hypothetical protein
MVSISSSREGVRKGFVGCRSIPGPIVGCWPTRGPVSLCARRGAHNSGPSLGFRRGRPAFADGLRAIAGAVVVAGAGSA